MQQAIIGGIHPLKDIAVMDLKNHQHRTFRQLVREMAHDYEELQSWTKVGTKWGLNKGTCYDIVVNGQEPHRPILRYHLGLPALVLAPPCPIHGVVHVAKRCPAKRNYHNLEDMPKKLLIWKLLHREEMK